MPSTVLSGETGAVGNADRIWGVFAWVFLRIAWVFLRVRRKTAP